MEEMEEINNFKWIEQTKVKSMLIQISSILMLNGPRKQVYKYH